MIYLNRICVNYGLKEPIFRSLAGNRRGERTPKSMKNFIAIFGICYVLSVIVIVFGEFIIFQNMFIFLIFTSLIIAALVTELMHQDDRIEALEKRIKKWDQDINQVEVEEDSQNDKLAKVEVDN